MYLLTKCVHFDSVVLSQIQQCHHTFHVKIKLTADTPTNAFFANLQYIGPHMLDHILISRRQQLPTHKHQTYTTMSMPENVLELLASKLTLGFVRINSVSDNPLWCRWHRCCWGLKVSIDPVCFALWHIAVHLLLWKQLFSPNSFHKKRNTSKRSKLASICARMNSFTLTLCHAGVYSFGLFTTTIFANAGQVVTGNQTPHFLSACKPNYTALGCQSSLHYITERRACTGNPYLVASARKSFPSKDAALSFYSAVYTVVRECLEGQRSKGGVWLKNFPGCNL